MNQKIREAATAHEALPRTGLRPAWRVKTGEWEYKTHWTWDEAMATVAESLLPGSFGSLYANACGRYHAVNVISCWAIDDGGEAVPVALSRRLHVVMVQGVAGPMVTAAFADGNVVP